MFWTKGIVLSCNGEASLKWFDSLWTIWIDWFKTLICADNFGKLRNPVCDLRYTFDRQLSPICHLSPQYPRGPPLGSDRVYFAPGPGSNGHSLSVLAVKWGEGWYPKEIDFIQGKISAPLHYSLQDWVQTPEVMIDNPHTDWKLVKSLTLQRSALFSPESYFSWRLPGLHRLWSALWLVQCIRKKKNY